MASMSDIRRSIGSIESTGQITKAMKMVASSKLRRAQSAVIAARPYSAKVREVLGNLSKEGGPVSNPLQEVRDVNKVLYIIVSADSGLCGGFNANVTKECERAIKANEHDCSVIAVGKKGRDYFQKRGYNVVSEYIGIGDTPGFAVGKKIAQEVIKMYTEGEYDEVHLIYSVFKSALSNVPTDIKLLPIEALPSAEADAKAEPGVGDEKSYPVSYTFEPSEEEVLDVLLPAYVETVIFSSVLESKASEHGSRMTAMSAATDNAAELIQSLTLTLNRARQAAITTEITEIVSGAAALE